MTVRVLHLMCAAFVLATVCRPASAQQVLDLTQVEKPADNRLVVTGVVGGPTDTPAPVVPLSITLVRTDATEYSWDRRIVFEVLLTNTGSAGVAIPNRVRRPKGDSYRSFFERRRPSGLHHDVLR
jgi:hypothetical protein